MAPRAHARPNGRVRSQAFTEFQVHHRAIAMKLGVSGVVNSTLTSSRKRVLVALETGNSNIAKKSFCLHFHYTKTIKQFAIIIKHNKDQESASKLNYS